MPKLNLYDIKVKHVHSQDDDYVQIHTRDNLSRIITTTNLRVFCNKDYQRLHNSDNYGIDELLARGYIISDVDMAHTIMEHVEYYSYTDESKSAARVIMSRELNELNDLNHRFRLLTSKYNKVSTENLELSHKLDYKQTLWQRIKSVFTGVNYEQR